MRIEICLDTIMAYWLFKTEPDTFAIDTLRVQNISCWEGVRNYQARNLAIAALKEKGRIDLPQCAL
ncbi:hypothetical protein ATY35_13885 [Vibrio cidicii]|uniref:EVE domain-containing protein n=1 Tax=Vibrio cidicii TaxID=1763883 RepID=A0ABR5W3H9_9VIBR|nr:hypothetical protein ATY35_13885 [Vibrio cidicii]